MPAQSQSGFRLTLRRDRVEIMLSTPKPPPPVWVNKLLVNFEVRPDAGGPGRTMLQFEAIAGSDAAQALRSRLVAMIDRLDAAEKGSPVTLPLALGDLLPADPTDAEATSAA